MSKNTNIADLINYISVDGSGNVVLTTGGQVATQSYVTTAVSNLVNSAPSTLDTLNELATALGNDANFATTVTTSIATKLPLAGGTLTGALSGTSATFSGNLEVFSGSAGVTVGDFLVNPTTKYVYVGRQSSTSGDNTTFVVRDRTGSARATIPGGGSIDTVFSTNNSNFIVSNYSGTSLMTIANTGAATFSSSVTSGSEFISYTGITMDAGGGAIRGGLTINYSTGEFKSFCGITGNTYFQTFHVNGSERMRITSSGVIGFNGSSDVANVSDKFSLGYFNSNYGWLQTWSSTPLYLNKLGNAVYAGSVRLDTLSDERVKDNIQPIENALSKVLSITGKKFHLKDEDEGKLRYGFIAQELEGILDEFVIQTDITFKHKELEVENVKSIENWGSSWAALLVEAIKEQQAQIEELRKIVATK